MLLLHSLIFKKQTLFFLVTTTEIGSEYKYIQITNVYISKI